MGGLRAELNGSRAALLPTGTTLGIYTSTNNCYLLEKPIPD